jgi:endonuclease YncB( thermonuclease family)
LVAVRRLSAIASLSGVAVLSAGLAAGATPTPPATAADRDCSDFDNQRQAQQYFESIGGPASDPDRLDADGDGRACDALPCPCGSGSPAPKPPKRAQTIKARITSVIDGDTIRAKPLEPTKRRRYIVRLIGIDTPETRKPNTPIECGGPEATDSMKRLAEGRRVQLRTDPTQATFDRNDRLLAYAKLRGGPDVGTVQLRRGWAKVYVYGKPFKRMAAYRRVAKAAKRVGRGAWGECGGHFHRTH